MTRKELIQRIQEGLEAGARRSAKTRGGGSQGDGPERGTELSQGHIAAVIDQLFEEMAGALQSEGRYAHPGFGTFTVKVQNARVGRSPRTGEAIAIPEGTTVSFKPSADLRARLERGSAECR